MSDPGPPPLARWGTLTLTPHPGYPQYRAARRGEGMEAGKGGRQASLTVSRLMVRWRVVYRAVDV